MAEPPSGNGRKDGQTHPLIHPVESVPAAHRIVDQSTPQNESHFSTEASISSENAPDKQTESSSSHEHRTQMTGSGPLSQESDVPQTPGLTQSADIRPSRSSVAFRACDACFTKKIKCTGEEPACRYCVTHNIDCTYDRQIKKRGPRAGYAIHLQKRIDELASMIRQRNPRLAESLFSNSLSSGHDGNDVDSEGEEDIPQQSFTHLHDVGSNQKVVRVNTSKSGDINAGGVTSVPIIRPDLIERHFKIMATRSVTLHKTTFLRDLNQHRPFLLSSFYTCILSVPNDDLTEVGRGNQKQDLDQYLVLARSLFHDALKQADLSTIFGFINLAHGSAASGKLGEAIACVDAAFRLAQQKRLFDEPSHEIVLPPKSLEQEYARRIAWQLFEVDRYSSYHHDIPFFMQEEEFRIGLPLWDFFPGQSDELAPHPAYNAEYQLQGILEYNHANIHHNQYLILLRLFGHVCSIVKPGVGNISQAERFALRQQKQLELTSFFTSLPPWMQILHPVYGDSPFSIQPPPWRAAYILLMYHFTLLLLYTPELQSLLHQYQEKFILDIQQVLANPLLGILWQHLEMILEVTQVYLRHDPKFHRCMPFVHKPIFIASVWVRILIHLLKRKESRSSSRPGVEFIQMHLPTLDRLEAGYTSLSTAMRSISKLWMAASFDGQLMQNMADRAGSADEDQDQFFGFLISKVL